jgi:hypothetical protein
MNIVDAVIVGWSTSTTYALVPKSERTTGILGKRKSCAAVKASSLQEIGRGNSSLEGWQPAGACAVDQ